MASPKPPNTGTGSQQPSTGSDDPRGLTPRGTNTKDRGLFHPPVLTARCYSREIEVPNSFNEFDAMLKSWIATCVTSRTRDPRTGGPYQRELDLVGGNRTTIDVWKQIEALRSVDAKGHRSRVRIYADYDFVSAGREEWGVSDVRFSVKDLPPTPPPPPAPRPPPPASHDYAALKSDLLQGEAQLKKLVDEAHGVAKGAAPMPAVTVSGADLMKDLVKRSNVGLAKDLIKGTVQDLHRSNMASDIAKRRGELYDAYIDGSMSALMPNYSVVSKRADRDQQAFFDLGRKRASDLSPAGKRQLLLAAVEAVRNDPTGPGSWFVSASPQVWDADDYEGRIKTPQIVQLGLSKVFHNLSNLVDAP